MEETIYVVIDLDSDKKDCCVKAFEDYQKAKEYIDQLVGAKIGYYDEYMIIEDIQLLKN